MHSIPLSCTFHMFLLTQLAAIKEIGREGKVKPPSTRIPKNKSIINFASSWQIITRCDIGLTKATSKINENITNYYELKT